MNEVFGFSIKEKFAKLDPNDQKGVFDLFNEAFKMILTNPQMGAIARAAQKTPIAKKYELLKQYVEEGGGTLRTNPDGTLMFAPKALKNAATQSQFGSGGTMGHTVSGGV